MVLAVDLLREANIPVTAQRVAVLNTVKNKAHATAEALGEEARAVLGAISQQSVYDALAIFTAKGLVRRIQPAGSPALYEARVGDNHHHVICRNCGLVADVDCSVSEAPCLTSHEAEGFLIDEAEVIYWGICPACQELESQ